MLKQVNYFKKTKCTLKYMKLIQKIKKSYFHNEIDIRYQLAKKIKLS